jgi:hypothetical protein
MTTKLNFARDVQGLNSFASPPSTTMYSATLAAGGNSSITVPQDYQNWIVSFSYQPGSDIWVAYNTSAAAPAGSTFAANHSELLPGARSLTAKTAAGVATTINLLNNGAGTADVGVIFYAVS